MKLETLNLDQFGKFSAKSFSFSEVTVFHGPNESGKTTLFDAIFMQLCQPSKTTKLGKALHQRYRKRISCSLKFNHSGMFDDPLNPDDFMNLQAIRAGDVHLELDDKRAWVQQLKQKLSGIRVAPEVLYKALEPVAASGSNRAINKEITDLQTAQQNLVQEIQHLTSRRRFLLSQEQENAVTESQLLNLKAAHAHALQEISTIEKQIADLSQAIKREDVEQELEQLYGFQDATAKLRSLSAFSAETQAALHRNLEAEIALAKQLDHFEKRKQQASRFKLSITDVAGLGAAVTLCVLTYVLWPAASGQPQLPGFLDQAHQLRHQISQLVSPNMSPTYIYVAAAVMAALLLAKRLRKHNALTKTLAQEERALTSQKTKIASEIHKILTTSGARSSKEFDQSVAAREAQEQVIRAHYHRLASHQDDTALVRRIKELERQLNHFDDQKIYPVKDARRHHTDLDDKLKLLRTEERRTIEQIFALEADFQRKAGEVKGAFGELPEKILALEKRLADVQEQLDHKLTLKQGAAIALSVLGDIIQDSNLDFERLVLLTNEFIGKFLNGRSIAMTKLNLHNMTFTDQYAQQQKPEHLSSGTRDLFVFALRLILFAQLAPRIPLLIFDDPFIHLDEGRTDLALEMLHFFVEGEAAGVQIILFTKSLDLASKVMEKFPDTAFIKL